MANSSFIRCSICTRDINQARMLPCFHSFCLECLRNKFENMGNRLNCPQCDLLFDLPEGGLEKLKRNEFIDKLAVNYSQPCGVCLDKVSEKFCIDCKQNICTVCLSVHSKLPVTKDHSVRDVVSTMSTNSEGQYCKSCQVFFVNNTDHGQCDVVDASEYMQKCHKDLLCRVAETYEDLSDIKKNLNFIDENKSSASSLAKLLKKQIHRQGDKLKSYIDVYIDMCTTELSERVDEECAVVKEDFNLSKTNLLNLETKFNQRIKEYQSLLRDFNQETVIDYDIGVLDSDDDDDDGLSVGSERNNLTKFLNDKFMLFFEPKIIQENLFKGNNIVGSLSKGRKPQPELIKIVKKDFGVLVSCSIDKMKLYGLQSTRNENTRELSYNVLRLCCRSYNQFPSVSIKTCCNTSYYYQPTESAIIVDRFLCTLDFSQNVTTLITYDLEKNEDSPVWKKETVVQFQGTSFFKSSKNSISILGDQTVFEITLDGDVINEIKLPRDMNGVSGIAHLGLGRYIVTCSKSIYVINNDCDIIKDLSKSILFKNYDYFLDRCQMITDGIANIFFYNCNYQEIIVINYDLDSVKRFDAMCKPHHICYDPRKDRLLIFGEKQLNVFQL